MMTTFQNPPTQQAPPGRMDLQAPPEEQDHKVQQDLKEPRETPALKVQQDRKERRAIPALQVCKDPWVLQGQKVTRAMLVRQAPEGSPVQRDRPDLRDPQAPRDPH